MTATDRLRRRVAARLELSDQRLDRRLSLFRQEDDAGRCLVTAIAREFADGFNATLRTLDPAAVRVHVDATEDDHLVPFYVEGAATALAAGHALRPRRGRSALRQLLAELPGHRYLIFAGHGWSYAVRPFGARTVRRSPVWCQDSLLAGLAVDGLAFATCFLKAEPPHFDLTCPFPEPEYETLWLQGYGRALWFASGAGADVFRRQYERLAPRQRPELCAGLGLATGFAGMRRLRAVPEAPLGTDSERHAFTQGLAFGLTARRQASPRSYARWVDELDRPGGAWVAAATDRCLRQPGPVAARRDGGYVAWQRQVRRDLLLVEQPR